MELLQDIQVSGTRKNPFAEAALERLLDSNLSAKYALTGNLSKFLHGLLPTIWIKVALLHKNLD